MKVVFYDAQKKLPLGNANAVYSLQELLHSADVITIHTPAAASTKNMINEETLQLFKKGAILINYARGEVLDMDSLKRALESELLSGAAIDVYQNEPAKSGSEARPS